jgi:HD superfamily phosphohydrolase
MKFVGEITDPIHKHIRFTKVEHDILDNQMFQRLRRIRQLAGAHLIYPSAQHSRFEHSLGTMHIAGYAAETLLSKGYLESEEEIQELRLAALLHDIGHGPFSHLFEEVLNEKNRKNHEDIGKEIILKSENSDIISRYGHDPSTISNLSCGQSKIKFLNEIIAGSLSADIMDYLPRDGMFTGTEYGNIDYHRLVTSFRVVTKNHLALDRSALYSFESMLISRYEMFKAVYFHKTVRSAEVMLLHSMLLADDQLNLTDISLENFLELTDENVLERIISLKHQNEIASKLAIDYRSRRLLKCVYERFLHRHDPTFKKINRDTLNDLGLRIAEEAGVSGSSVFVDSSRASSMPLTPNKKEISSVILSDRKRTYEIPVTEIPIIDSITGFLNMLRVYTTAESRNPVEKCISRVIERERSEHG